jgi:hypothetical protein
MSTIILPVSPKWRRATPEFIDSGVDQRPSTGVGVTQRLERLGGRWALTVELPPIREGATWLDYQVAFALARRDGAAYPWPQPGLVTNSPAVGTPVIRDAGQTGSTVILSGLNTAYTVKKGQFLSLLAGGYRYLYQATAAAVPTFTGDVAIPIFPMLKASPDHLFAVELVEPWIYGSITSDNLGWSHEFNPFLTPRFRIEEVR